MKHPNINVDSLKGIKHPEKIQVLQVCQCRGEHHRVALINNSLVLPDHNLKRERAFLELGAEPCKCMKIYMAFRKHETEHLVQDFDKYMPTMKAKFHARKHKREYSAFGTWIMPVKSKDLLPAPLQRKICLLLRHKCTYPFINDDTSLVITDTRERPFITGSWSYRNDVLGADKIINLRINLCHNWEELVYKKGVAVIDNLLILQADTTGQAYYKELPMSVMAMVNKPSPYADTQHTSFREHYFISDVFGIINGTVIRQDNQWRFKHMDSHVYYHKQPRHKWS